MVLPGGQSKAFASPTPCPISCRAVSLRNGALAAGAADLTFFQNLITPDLADPLEFMVKAAIESP